MPYPYATLDFGNPFEGQPLRETTEEEAKEFDATMKQMDNIYESERWLLNLMMNNRPSKFASELFLMQCDWDELPLYKKWYFHICKFFGVWYDWNKGKYLS